MNCCGLSSTESYDIDICNIVWENLKILSYKIYNPKILKILKLSEKFLQVLFVEKNVIYIYIYTILSYDN